MTLDFQTFNLTQKAEGGGGSGTTNHAQLSNLDYANAGHTGFMSSENYIPANTIINVKLDGSGDFTKLSDALTYLTGKWSNGIVTIQLGSGTFVENTELVIDFKSIPELHIRGVSASNTILQDGRTAGTGMTTRFIKKVSGDVYLENIKLIGVGSSISNYRGYDDLDNYGRASYLYNVTFDGFNAGIVASSTMKLGGAISVSNCNTAITSSAYLSSIWSNNFTFTNITTAFVVNNGGQIHIMNANCTYTNVTNRVSQTVGTATNNGWITGITV